MNLLIETEIAAPADRVWTILAHQFAEIATWSSTVSSSEALTEREVPAHVEIAPTAPVPGRTTTSRAGTFKEIIVEYSDQDRVLLFDTDGLPKLFTKGTDRQRVIALGPQRSRVSFNITMEARFPLSLAMPLLKKRMGKTFSFVQDELRSVAERGSTNND